MPSLILNGSERLGREKNLFQGGGRRSKIRRGVGVGERRLHLSVPPPHRPLNCKSNMAGRINDCEFIALACINKTPALQANIISNLLPLHFYSVRKVSKAEIYTKGNRTCLKTTFLLHSINLK